VPDWKITPLVVAIGPQREKSRFTYMDGFGDKVDIPYVSWLLQDGTHNVLVDTGCSAASYAEKVRPADGPLMLAGEQFADVQDVVTLEDRLAEQGLDFSAIDLVIQTHLDWDHTMNTPKFAGSGARVVVQRREWELIPAHPLFASTYAPKETYAEIEALGLELLDGDQEILPGLELLVTPGHSPAGQSIVVQTAEGPHVIVGMCTIAENFWPSEDVLRKGTYTVIPTGMHIDPIQTYDSILRIKAIPDARILPFHDIAVLDYTVLG
jgi:glyoxylase-like metal-dependent hydrolase (beta-lactamase superfamily II)